MLKSKEKILVFRCMESNINSQKCKLNLSALMIIIILLISLDKMLKNNMNFCKNNMRQKKKRLMTN